MHEPESNSDSRVKAVVGDDLLALLDSEIAQARDRQFNLTRDAEIATVKNQIVGEYRARFIDLRDKLRAKISEANAKVSHGDGSATSMQDNSSNNQQTLI